MKRYQIIHQTEYKFSESVQLLPHSLRLRPREGHELRIESSKLEIIPAATLRWHRDVEGNSVSIASFLGATEKLFIRSEVVVEHYDSRPQDFVVDDNAVYFPFSYPPSDRLLLSPYMADARAANSKLVAGLLSGLSEQGERPQTVALLLRLCQRIFQRISYRRREEEGVQTAEQTLLYGTGSCRDTANLFMIAAQQLGFAARFVSGYIHSSSSSHLSGATHAWSEVYLPGAGWKGFDPTIGQLVGSDHMAVAVARLPESVPPVAGRYFGTPGSTLEVNVWVSDITPVQMG